MVMPGSVTLTVSAYVPAGTRTVSPGSAASTAAWIVVVTTMVSPAAWLAAGTGHGRPRALRLTEASDQRSASWSARSEASSSATVPMMEAQRQTVGRSVPSGCRSGR